MSNDGTCGPAVPVERIGLRSLAENEALTLSHAPGENSVLRGAIPIGHPLCDGTDQCGLARRGAGLAACDIGAHQSAPAPRNIVAPSIPTMLAEGLTEVTATNSYGASALAYSGFTDEVAYG